MPVAEHPMASTSSLLPKKLGRTGAQSPPWVVPLRHFTGAERSPPPETRLLTEGLGEPRLRSRGGAVRGRWEDGVFV